MSGGSSAAARVSASRRPDSPESSPGDDGVLSQLIGREPDPRWTYEAAEECQQLLDRLSDTLLRAIALWKIEGFTTEEIAAKLGCAIADGRAEAAAHPQALEGGADR